MPNNAATTLVNGDTCTVIDGNGFSIAPMSAEIQSILSAGDLTVLELPNSENLGLDIPALRPIIAQIDHISPDRSEITIKFCNSIAFRTKWFRVNQGMVKLFKIYFFINYT